MKSGVIADAFPVEQELLVNDKSFTIEGDSLSDVTEGFNIKHPDQSPFKNAGLVIGRDVLTVKTTPVYKGRRIFLGDILEPDSKIDPSFIIPDKEIKDWTYLKGAKSIQRTKPNGVVYSYDEGPIAFPDPLDRPARTIITGEGGATPSRFKHVVKMKDGRCRRLMPVELERINTFPSDHTKLDGISDVKRAFFMGNALVTEVITRLGRSLAHAVENH